MSFEGWYCVRLSLLAYSVEHSAISGGHVSSTTLRWPVAASAVCGQWTPDGVWGVSCCSFCIVDNALIFTSGSARV